MLHWLKATASFNVLAQGPNNTASHSPNSPNDHSSLHKCELHSSGLCAPSIKPPRINLWRLATAAESCATGTSKDITITSFCTVLPGPRQLMWKEVCNLGYNNHLRYATRHGYAYRFFACGYFSSLTERHPVWWKLPFLLNVIRNPAVRFAFWVDADSLFMNMNKNLTFLLPPWRKHITFSPDLHCSVNAGQMMLAASHWSEMLLHKWWDIDPPPFPELWREQASLMYLLSGERSHCRKSVWDPKGVGPTCFEGKPCSSHDSDGHPHDCCRNVSGYWANHAVQLAKVDMNAWWFDFHAGEHLMITFAGKEGKDKLMRRYLANTSLFTPSPVPILNASHGMKANL
mmetsp:Transcript_75059/g.125085  ORF Transcript_75059/g.125085 Transcript_75059/m.125085 type:complete len:344 (+) Transcript_75059:45-1076(+)